MMRCQHLALFFTLLAFLAVGSDARLSSQVTKTQKKRHLQNNGYNYGYYNYQDQGNQGNGNYNNGNYNGNNGNYNNAGDDQNNGNNDNNNANNYNNGGNYNYNGQNNGYYDNQGNYNEQGQEEGSQDQEAEQGSQDQDYYYQDQYQNQDYDFDAQSDVTDDGFHVEQMTVENYKKLLKVHDKMEAFRLATILLCVVVVYLMLYVAYLRWVVRSYRESTDKDAKTVASTTQTVSKAPLTNYERA
ncbi:expressed unknown protein [Seminavis robusta]|uniref:Uncharacterized protein n=1 Tax=Seminavis robusta TaxID=568900 RepID=A0A9N8E9R4_9STRA|nr:expressed unknown protein [Seminavis robusta]|eukprot:Sro781_g201570.1 n/a (243) ;mRNA; f:26110-26838